MLLYSQFILKEHQENDKDVKVEDIIVAHKTNNSACKTKPRDLTIKPQEAATKTRGSTIKPRESVKNTDFGRHKKKLQAELTDNKSTKNALSSTHVVKIHKNPNLKAAGAISQKKPAYLEVKASNNLKSHFKKKSVTVLSKPAAQRNLPSASPQPHLVTLGQSLHSTKNLSPKNIQRNVAKQTSVLTSNKKVLSQSKEKVFIYVSLIILIFFILQIC